MMSYAERFAELQRVTLAHAEKLADLVEMQAYKIVMTRELLGALDGVETVLVGFRNMVTEMLDLIRQQRAAALRKERYDGG